MSLKLITNMYILQSHRPHLYLQGEDKLYLNVTSGLTKVYKMTQSNNKTKDQLTITSALVENKQWIIVYAPSPYLGTNWPIRVILIHIFIIPVLYLINCVFSVILYR